MQDLLESLIKDTAIYWQKWIAKSKYKGRWREAVHRSALVLKVSPIAAGRAPHLRFQMLVFEETGAIVAAPTFALPEHIGGPRNWRVGVPNAGDRS
jgi:GH15 family glucan-1,4-alpha-glucosidase